MLYSDGSDHFTIEYGPIDLAPAGRCDGMREWPAVPFVLPADGWMRGYSVELTDATGRRLPQDLLHHVNVMMKGRRDLFNRGMLRVGAAGPETAPVRLPRLFGVPAHRGDTLLLTFMPSESAESHRRVMMRIVVPFTSARAWLGAIAVYPFSIAIGRPGQPDMFDIPPGRSEHMWEGVPSADGRLLALSGHLHRYAVSLRLEDRTRGKTLWEVKPESTASGVAVVPRTYLLWPLGVRVRRDHVYRAVAVYDNPTGQTVRDGGMGVLGGIMTLAAGERWPAVDTRDPEYVADVNAVTMPTMSEMSHPCSDAAAARPAPAR